MLWNRGRQGGVLKHMGNAQILIFLAVRVLLSLSFWAVKERLILEMHEMIKNGACCCVCDCFHFALWSRLARTIAKIFQKWWFLGIFSRLGYFAPVFGQVEEWFILELLKMIKTRHVVAYPMVFLSFVIEVAMKVASTYELQILFKHFWPLWSVSPGIWADPSADHALFNKSQQSMFYIFVPNTFSFLFGSKTSLKIAETWEKWSILNISAVYVFSAKFFDRLRSSLF